jgi:DNA-binding NtrC family response regulator
MAQRLLLLGLEEETATRLAAVLPAAKYEIHIVPGAAVAQWLGKLDTLRPNVICLPADPAAAAPLMQAVRTRLARAPMVLVSNNPNPAEWRLAMAEGASDYFGPPFLPGQVDWILNSASSSLPMGSYLTA